MDGKNDCIISTVDNIGIVWHISMYLEKLFIENSRKMWNVLSWN